MGLAENLRTLREAQGLNVKELAELAGIDDSIISRIENGKTPDPQRATLLKLARALQVSLGVLLGEEPFPPGPTEREKRMRRIERTVTALKVSDPEGFVGCVTSLPKSDQRELERIATLMALEHRLSKSRRVWEAITRTIPDQRWTLMLGGIEQWLSAEVPTTDTTPIDEFTQLFKAASPEERSTIMTLLRAGKEIPEDGDGPVD